MIRLKNWSIYMDDCVGWRAPELFTYHLQGNAYGHPRFEDGDPVSTSSIVEINDRGDYKEATTRSGSVYGLYKEDVDPECEIEYPNYYERLKLEGE